VTNLIIVIVKEVISQIMLSTNIQARTHEQHTRLACNITVTKFLLLHNEIQSYIRSFLFQTNCKMHRKSKHNSPLCVIRGANMFFNSLFMLCKFEINFIIRNSSHLLLNVVSCFS